MKMPTTPPIKPAIELIAEAGMRLADAAGAARVLALAPPLTVRAAVNVVEAAAVRATTVGENRLVLDRETTAGPTEGSAPVLATGAVAAGAPAALVRPTGAVVGRLLAAANNVFGVARLARLGPVGMETCFMGADAFGICPVGAVVPAAARTPTATAAVMTVFLLAIVIAYSFPQGGFVDWLAGES
jgi:hypothetical protein